MGHKPHISQLLRWASDAQSQGQWASALSNWNQILKLKQDPRCLQQRGLCYWYLEDYTKSVRDFQQSYNLYLHQKLYSYKSFVSYVSVLDALEPKEDVKRAFIHSMNIVEKIGNRRQSDLIWRCLSLGLELIDRHRVLADYYLPQPWEDWDKWGIDPAIIVF